VPRRLPLLGHALDFGRDPDGFMALWRQRLGDSFRVAMPGGERIFLCNPFDAPRVFAEPRLRFHEASAEIGAKVFGYDAARAARHDTQVLSNALSRDMRGAELQAMSERMQVFFVRRIVDDLRAGPKRISLMQMLTRHFFAAGLDAFFGESMYTPELYRAYERVDRSFALVVAGVPARLIPGFARASDALAVRAGLRLPHRAMALDHRGALFAELGIPATESKHYDASIIWASQANTVAAAFWTVRFILGAPEARAAITEEVRALAEPAASPLEARPFPKNALGRMRLLDSATQEAMRLTAGPILTRRASEDFRLALDNGRTLPLKKGEEIFIYPRLHQIDREIFEHPHCFQYDRFLDDGRPARFFRDGRRITMPTLPFGGGVSMCPGRHFAQNEIKILVATLLLWLDAELCSFAIPGLDFSRIGLGILPPKQDVELLVRLRRSSRVDDVPERRAPRGSS
jgi:cytochrome P450